LETFLIFFYFFLQKNLILFLFTTATQWSSLLMVEGQRRSFGVSPPEQILSALNQNCNFVYEKKKSLYAISEIENSLYGTR